MKPIQKLTGKLGQKLRDVEEELGSADIKYVINSIISAVELDNLDEEDKEDILDRFEDDEAEYGDEEEVEDIEMGDEEMDMEMGDEEIGDEDIEVEDEEEMPMESTRKRRAISLKQRVGNLLESYIDKKSNRNKKSLQPKKYINSRLNVIKERKNVKGHCSTVEQEIRINNFLKKNKSFNFKTKTKSGNIILEGRNKTVIVDKKGIVR